MLLLDRAPMPPDYSLRPASPQVVQIRQKIQSDMIERLLECSSLQSDAGRQILVEMIAGAIGQRLPVHSQGTLRIQLFEIVMWCAKVPEGLPILIDTVIQLEQETWHTITLQLLLDEWLAVDLVPTEDWPIFRSALSDLAPPKLNELFIAATRSRLPSPPARCTTAWQIFVYLTGVNAGADGLSPSMIFLDQLAELLPSEIGQEIRLRNRRRAGQLGLIPALNTAVWGPSEAEPKVPSSAYLVIQLEADGVDADRYLLSHWHQWDTDAWRPRRGDDRLVHRAKLESAVEKLVADIEARSPNLLGTMTLEFVLPWELLNAPVDWWRKETQSSRPTPLAMDYPIVVRSLERLRTRRWHRLWHQRWLRARQDGETSTQVYWSSPSGNDYLTLLETDLKSDDRITSLILSEPPHIDGAGLGEVEAALRAGLPVIIWHRSDCTRKDFVNAVSDLTGGTLAELPARARELRRQALRLDPDIRDSHIGRHLTVLWDDPERQPEVARSSGLSEEGNSSDSAARP
jgi:hypothetical protein